MQKIKTILKQVNIFSRLKTLEQNQEVIISAHNTLYNTVMHPKPEAKIKMITVHRKDGISFQRRAKNRGYRKSN